MNEESIEKEINHHEADVGHEQKAADLNEVYTEAREDFYKKQEEADKLKAEEIKKSLENTPLRATTTEAAKQEGTTFAPKTEKKSTNSFLKKAAVWGGLTLAGLFSSKDAQAQKKMNQDKEGIKKEVVLENVKELSAQEKGDWGEYVTYVKERGLDKDERMNHRAFANQILHEFLAQHKGTTTLNEEQVLRIQADFQKLREWTVEKIKNHEQINGHYVEFAEGVNEDNFMANLSELDKIAGPKTIRYYGADYDQMMSEQKTNLKDLGGKGINVEYSSVTKKGKPTAGDFVSREDK